jgi:hypothetical protein
MEFNGFYMIFIWNSMDANGFLLAGLWVYTMWRSRLIAQLADKTLISVLEFMLYIELQDGPTR